jgi:eukaryotic-like serine/threonine-protein kinase
VGAETVATLAGSPTSTIVPPVARPTTGGARALEVLEELAGDTEQLRIGSVIGEGGMGIVHAAEQVALGRTVAVKSLKPGRRDPVASLDLLREAWVTGSLEHPNIVPVHYLKVMRDGPPSIVLKRIEGVEWSRLLHDAGEVERRFGAKDLLAWNVGILLQVLNALRFAHRHGILHRDLKPSNVMIGDYGEVYLLDWGIAVSLRDDGSGRLPLASHAAQLAGTPCYMAPEMLGREGDLPLSERTDV